MKKSAQPAQPYTFWVTDTHVPVMDGATTPQAPLVVNGGLAVALKGADGCALIQMAHLAKLLQGLMEQGYITITLPAAAPAPAAPAEPVRIVLEIQHGGSVVHAGAVQHGVTVKEGERITEKTVERDVAGLITSISEKSRPA